MPDNFSANHVQGVVGEFRAVLDETVAFSVNNVQGVVGEFIPVLDEAAGVAAPVVDWLVQPSEPPEARPEVVAY